MWSGEMAENDEARLEIEWVEMVYNTSGPVTDYESRRSRMKLKRAEEECAVMCTVDEGGNSTIVNGGYLPTTSAAARVTTLWKGTNDKEFIVATTIGALVSAVLYIIDTRPFVL